ncbi:MAG: aromatic amino acid lyase, partial [Pseudomonadota bacterium]
MTVILDRLQDISLQEAWQVGFEGHPITLSDRAAGCIIKSRDAFERLLSSETPPYMYGSTTAPGARAKVKLSVESQEELVRIQNLWASREIGMGRKMVPDHGVRLILMARVASYIEGHVA